MIWLRPDDYVIFPPSSNQRDSGEDHGLGSPSHLDSSSAQSFTSYVLLDKLQNFSASLCPYDGEFGGETNNDLAVNHKHNAWHSRNEKRVE